MGYERRGGLGPSSLPSRLPLNSPVVKSDACWHHTKYVSVELAAAAVWTRITWHCKPRTERVTQGVSQTRVGLTLKTHYAVTSSFLRDLRSTLCAYVLRTHAKGFTSWRLRTDNKPLRERESFAQRVRGNRIRSFSPRPSSLVLSFPVTTVFSSLSISFVLIFLKRKPTLDVVDQIRIQ